MADLLNHQLWQGNHTWWFNGRIVTGKRPWKLGLSLFLFNLTNLVSFSQTWVVYSNWGPLGFGVTMWLLVDTLMLLTACSDPGFIPKHEEDSHVMQHRHRFYAQMVLDGMNSQQTHLILLKFCGTCNIVRPKRAIHCSDCDTCVEQMDHHCPFVSTCIGRRNYVYFWCFCCALWVDTLFITIITFVDLRQKLNDADVWTQLPLSVPIGALAAIALILMSLLVGFHIKLNSLSQTTFESVKQTFENYEQHPFRTSNCLTDFLNGVFIKKPKRTLYRPRDAAYINDQRTVGHYNEIQNKTPGNQLSEIQITIVQDNAPLQLQQVVESAVDSESSINSPVSAHKDTDLLYSVKMMSRTSNLPIRMPSLLDRTNDDSIQ